MRTYTLTGSPAGVPASDETSTDEPASREPIPDGGVLLYRTFLGAVIVVAADVAGALGGALLSLGRGLFS
jgi:hypothetical protein